MTHRVREQAARQEGASEDDGRRDDFSEAGFATGGDHLEYDADPGELEQQRDGHGHGQHGEREVVQHAGGARGEAQPQQGQHALGRQRYRALAEDGQRS